MNITDKNLKVLNITHHDLDGMVSHILLKNVYKECICVPITHSTEKTLMAKVNEYAGDFDVIIITDFYPEKFYFDLKDFHKPIYIFDHHDSSVKYHNGKNIFIKAGSCATKQIYKMYSKITDLSKFEHLVDLVNDFDLGSFNEPEAKDFNNIFWEMGYKWFIHRFSNGNLEFSPEEKTYLIEADKEVQKEYDKLNISDLPNNGIFFQTSRYQTNLVSKLKNDGYKWFVILNKNNLSIRADNIDLIKVSNLIGRGGGLKSAIGIPLKFKENPKLVINKVVKAVNEVLLSDM